jgi:hypothetical protein
MQVVHPYKFTSVTAALQNINTGWQWKLALASAHLRDGYWACELHCPWWEQSCCCSHPNGTTPPTPAYPV